MKPIVVGIGELLWDMLPTGKKIGGAPVNFVYHAAMNGSEGYVITAIGNDTYGDEILSEIEKYGVNVILNRNSYPTGLVNVSLDLSGIAEYDIVENSAWDYLEPNEKAYDIIRRCDCVCFGTLAQRNHVSRQAILDILSIAPNTAIKFFDINLRQHYFDKEIILNSLSAATILKLNNDELRVIGQMLDISEAEDSIADRLIRDHDLQYLILTCGDSYSKIYSKSGEMSHLITPKVRVSDTIGAGDSFSGTFISEILNGTDMREAHQKAVDISAWVCTQSGAFPKYPK